MIERLRRLLARGADALRPAVPDRARRRPVRALAALEVPRAVRAHHGDRQRLPEVAHNYRREHALNMWFVVAAETPERRSCAWRHRGATALEVHALPKERIFRRLKTAGDGRGGPWPCREFDRSADRRHAGGLPLVARPTKRWAAMLGVGEASVRDALGQMLAEGLIRTDRRGAQPLPPRLHRQRHDRCGTWPTSVDELRHPGRRAARRQPLLSSPRELPIWRYNLFAMVHGRSRDEVERQAAQIARRLLASDIRCRAKKPDILFIPPLILKDQLLFRLTEKRFMTCSAFRSTCANLPRPSAPAPPAPATRGTAPAGGPVLVVIWNLIRRCNLTCKALLLDLGRPRIRRRAEHAGRFTVMDDLRPSACRC